MPAIKYVTGNLLEATQRHLIQGCNAKKKKKKWEAE